ncbi:MAG: 3-dehydro-L-gulonate 2-dehydrogenase [Gemmatimonadetes bacterium]|jgi:3-dehydro-L-gulonate 2-dehydrogenase|nr:3-dehydro-L-gulonate 2-dehydrogenase [Gemmatimonadota bacterium]MBT6150076.1 3-dehydro-L-gulonate 2-dehydrogenase [Gemmatimonadota bacterium]MBT7861070.1 3-dehydro-L-gulonate 2-dehydrogenase [Gemmatimonadota bacterium]
MQRIPHAEMLDLFTQILLSRGFTPDRARETATIFTDNTCDGVPSHGLHRFPGFVQDIDKGRVDPAADATCSAAFGALEQWDANRGPGVLTATTAMARAVEIAQDSTLGCVALRNANHWMRAATYGLQAAAADCLAISWTNTTRLMPPHGSAEKRLGNNPLCIAVPSPDGDTVLLDMAISQFSGGRTDTLRRTGESFPVPGGYDEAGQLTTDPGAVRRSGRPLPIGYWKGSGLALCLDLLATLLSGGSATWQIAGDGANIGVGCTQVFIAFDLASIDDGRSKEETVASILADLGSAAPLEGEKVTYPGQRSADTRRLNLAEGIPVDAEIWQEACGMLPT